MLPSFIITFRETLEAALVIGIIISYLTQRGERQHIKIIIYSVVTAIVSSIGLAYIFERFLGGFEGRAEEIFEGVVMIIGAILLTTLILWMFKQKGISNKLKNKVELELSKKHIWGLFAIVFVAVLREGVETIIFLKAAHFSSGENNMIGAIMGIIFAIILGYLLFKKAISIDIKKCFSITSILLVLFAAGLVAHGIHELQEANVIPTILNPLYDINPTVITENAYPVLHENGYVGSIFKELFGYNGNPSTIEFSTYILYLLIVGTFWKISKKTDSIRSKDSY